MALKLVTEPQNLPLSLNEAKAYLKFEDADTADEARIMAVLRAATGAVEDFTERALITQTWRYSLDNFIGAGEPEPIEGWSEGPSIIRSGGPILIPKPPLQSVASVVWFGSDDVPNTVAATVYFVDTDSEPGRVVVRLGQVWPSGTLRRAGGVQVTFVAGYGDTSAAIPRPLIEAVAITLIHFYDCPADASAGLPATVRGLLKPYWPGPKLAGTFAAPPVRPGRRSVFNIAGR